MPKIQVILTGNNIESIKSVVNRLKLQGGTLFILMAKLPDGRIKTPKSILYPSVIKSLTNCTEVITLSNKPGRVSDTILIERFYRKCNWTE